MRIALLTDKIATGGGIEHIYQLCAGMPDIEFGVFGAPGDAIAKFRSLKNVRLVLANDRATVDRFAPDLVHYHHLRPLARWSAPSGRKLFTIHGIHLHRYEFKAGLRARLERLARLELEKMLYRRIDRIITVSGDDAAFLRQHHGLDSTTIYNGIDFAPIDAEAAVPAPVLRARLGWPLDARIYLMVARFDFPKGHDVLIRAIGVMKQNGTLGSRLFILAGDGALRPAIEALAIRLGVIGHLRFLGTRRDVYTLMAASDVFVLPSRWEGLPITLIETLVAGRSAIASETYGITAVARATGRNIRLFRNEDENDLARALDEPHPFEACNLEMFSLPSMIAATKAVYLEAR